MAIETINYGKKLFEIEVVDGYQEKYPDIENLPSFLEPQLDNIAIEYNIPKEIASILKQAFFDIAELISKTRSVLELQTFQLDHFIILARELYYTASLHRDKEDTTKARKRKDGTYYIEHLVETAKNIIQLESLTSLFSVLSGIKHDDKEDIDGIKENKIPLTIIVEYKEQLKYINSPEVEKLQKYIEDMVEGVTKIKGLDKKETADKTFAKLLEAILAHGIRIAYLKIADRIHNIETLSGHGNKEKEKDIARETESVYVLLAHIMKLRYAEDRLIQGATVVLNPKLVDDYQELVKKKKETFVDKFEEKIKEHLMGNDYNIANKLHSITFVSHPLSKMIRRSKSNLPIEKMKIETFNIDQFDPLHDIQIIVQKNEDIDNIISELVKKFGTAQGCLIKPLENNRGRLLKVFNKDFGRRLFFRINDKKSETHARRGLMSNRIEDFIPEDFKGIITELLKITNNTREGIIKLAKNELLQPHIKVRTPEGEVIELPKNSTSLDLAVKIHRDILIGAQPLITVYDTLLSDETRRVASFFELLQPETIIHIDSCLSTKDGNIPNRKEIKVDHGWLIFCNTSKARQILRHYLQNFGPHKEKTSNTKLGEFGIQFVNKICNIFQIKKRGYIIQCIKEKFTNLENPNKIYQKIGKGEINVLEILSEKLFSECRKWKVKITLINAPATFEPFLAKFNTYLNRNNEENVTIKHMSQRNKQKAIITLEAHFFSDKMQVYDFMKEILRLHYSGYNIQVSPLLDDKKKI